MLPAVLTVSIARELVHAERDDGNLPELERLEAPDAASVNSAPPGRTS
jgi:hypothetical protein